MPTPSPSPLPSSSSPPPLVNPRDITSPEQITAQLALVARREADLSLALNALISDRQQVESALAHLQELSPEIDRLCYQVDGVNNHAPPFGANSRGLGLQNGDDTYYDDEDVGLVERVRRVWETSERVGGKVKRLDQEVGRVKEATDIVTEVLELKNALQTLSAAIDKEDWESASRACRRAMSVRKEVIDSGFAGGVVPTPQNPLQPSQQLEELRSTLLRTFREQFDAAAERRDQQAVSRFFRLWPGIGAEQEGLNAYGDFVVGLVKARSSSAGKPSSPLYYLTNLTSLLESIAHIIDQHQPVVDKYYGKGRMRTVVGRLVGESDRVIRNLVEGWEEERRVGRLISDTRQSQFQILSNPTLLPPLFSTLSNPSAPQLSLAALATSTTSHLPNLQSAQHLLQSYAPGAKRPQGQSSTPVSQAPVEEDLGPDPKDVDRILGELVALGGRWAMFKRFVWDRVVEDKEADEKKMDDMEIVEQSGSQKAIENLLKVYYEPLEIWFLRTSIEKAHRLETPDLSTRPHLSSILDDTFYLLKLILNRVLSCGSLSSLRVMRHKIGEVIEKDYIGVLRRKMDGVYALPHATGVEREKRERDQKIAFIIWLNDLDTSADYVERLVDELRRSLPQIFLPAQEKDVLGELDVIAELAGRFRASCRSGLEQLFNQLTRPKLRSVLDECYKDVSYLLDDDGFAEAEEMDLVRKRFIRVWEGLVDGYRETFTDHNYQAFFSMTLEILVRPWEKLIMNMKYTELGAIRYDKDIRSVVNFLSTQTSFGGVREKFNRLQQIGTVLNIDAEEDPEEFYSNSGISWRLSKVEYDTVLGLRQ
ncbi:hypothetical protein TREMEDRAFT_70757 [Tremella mesenterica DSM 1558]|uniref:uncharacterized protein n=1 Tax=Tremella mesenterica (strain ATCC 24925 / CBS 8224 / DSM 1558 / NBRC 9311 / NRRL Y-6157 / RJB 2259-6 / UBC 559-6) TaxID=578456 RepID=UPI0003F496A8|nr:uncharacterized protein TREMEDRAFT_70757 [Tremella mesenterica DSM 1558]EIW72587.1 hypothetical protein TREMEDRAFT_70757 [Tremella mesenterica DSM 1558]